MSRIYKTNGEKYPVGSKWKMKETNIFNKGDIVTITDNGKPGKDREVIVTDDLGRSALISVKKLWKRIS